MSLVLADRVRETTQTTGTGTITLGGAAQGFQSFSVIGNNNTTYYTINRGTEWEVGIGTYYGGTLSRDTVYASSNGTSKVNFSAGSKDVFVTYPSEKSVNGDANNRVLIPYTSGTTNVGSLNVGDATAHTDTGVIAGFTASEPLYLYTSLQNTSASNTSYASYAVNDGGHTAYGELGINNANYSYTAAGYPNNGFSTPLASFVESFGGPLVLGSWDSQKISFIVNGAVNTSDAMTIQTTGAVTIPSVAITGGTIDGATIGGTTPAAGTFTTLTAQTEVLKGTGQNLLIYSEDTTNAGYSKTRLTAATNATTSPTGSANGNQLTVDSSASTTHDIAQFYSPLPTGSVITISVYAKKNTFNYFALDGRASGVGFQATFNINTGTVFATASIGGGVYQSSSITSIGNGWYRCSVTGVATSQSNLNTRIYLCDNSGNQTFTGDGTSSIYAWGFQLELSTTMGTYIATTSASVYGTPTLSFSGVAGLGLQSDGSLYVQPAGTGAIQAQATTSSATGGNARGANAVDWQNARASASSVASGTYSTIGGGYNNATGSQAGVVVGGNSNVAGGNYGAILGGISNQTGGGTPSNSAIVGGQSNIAAGWFNFIGGGFTNSGTSSTLVTTQSGTMNATTAVTLSGSNASIKVGQYITGTSIAANTHVAAISGTSLTLSQVASGSSTSTLTFWTPHGVVVGGGNNQATGSYSFIGGGGDAGTAANRNVASGAWSTVAGGWKGTASGEAAFVGGGGSFGGGVSGNTASGTSSFAGAGYGNSAGGYGSAVVGGASNTVGNNYSFIGGGNGNSALSISSSIVGGSYGSTRSITGMQAMPACSSPISGTLGITQAGLLVLARETTNATATVLTSDSSAASGTNQVILAVNSAYYFRGEVIAGVTAAGDTKGWYIEGAIKRATTAASTALVGTPTVTSLYADAGAATWTVAVAADTTNGGLKVTVTGAASTTIRWVAQIRTTEMTF